MQHDNRVYPSLPPPDSSYASHAYPSFPTAGGQQVTSPVVASSHPLQQPAHRHSHSCSCCHCKGRCCWCGFGMTIRILSHVLSLVPIFASFAMMSAANLSFGMANVSAIVVGLVCLFLDYLLYRKRLTRVFPKQLGVANICLSSVSSVLAFTTDDVVMKQWSSSLTLGCLSVMLIVGMMISRPLKLEQYQDMVPRAVWRSKVKHAILVELATRSTRVYLTAFLVMTAINVGIAANENCPVDGNCTLQNSSLIPLLLRFFVPFIVMASAHKYISKHIPSWRDACEYDEEAEKLQRKQRKIDRQRNNIQSYQHTADNVYVRVDPDDDDDDDDDDDSDDEVYGVTNGVTSSSTKL